MDPEGQRTGVVTNYVDCALGWQHWFSPQIEVRPEIAYYRSLNANAFNGNVNARNSTLAQLGRDCGQRPNRSFLTAAWVWLTRPWQS